MESNSVRKTTPQKFITQPSNLLAVVIITFFFISEIMTLHNYGVTWDEGLGNLFFGERYLRYFTSFNEKYLDFNADLKSLILSVSPSLL